MPAEDPSGTLDTNVTDVRAARFEAAWLNRPADQPPPRWQDYLPAADEPASASLVLLLLQMDIECRVKAGLPALLAEPYFRHPRLQRPDALLEGERQRELIRWEYQQRWQNGQRARRGEYQAAFPEHADALGDLKPRSTCPHCRQTIVLEETVQTLHCPACESASPRSTLPTEGGSSSGPVSGLDLRDYELIERLGSGGMGDVYRAGDPALGRDLAVKVMKADFRGYASAERRFLREARVTGSLQHPGIVPIHNLGRLKDGRLHYTMRLVRGRTFADILRDEAGRPERWPDLLTIFLKVCQAVAYAHSKRVIHRDLKPANVMVGRFGEVQVMDWGLAKVLTAENEPTAAEEAGTRIHTEADTPLEQTRMGREMGTPGYMPPEQALGEWDTVDERADVFALGTILCEILTGQPPYRGGDALEVLRKAKRGDLAEAFARLDRCGADPPLVGLCRECLAPEREGRPRDAGAVERRVAAYQAEVQERLRRAELERAEAQVTAREERKRRRLVVLLAAMALLLVGGGVAALWWQQRQDALARQGVEEALAEVERLQQQTRWGEARAVLEQAEGRLSQAGAPDLRRRLEQARHDLELVARLDAVRLRRVTLVEGRFDSTRADREYALALQESGLGEAGEDTSAVAARVRTSAVSGVLVAALDDWAGCASEARRDWIWGVARQADPDEGRNRLRDPKKWNDGAELVRLAETQVADLSPQLLVVVGMRLLSLGKDAGPLLRKAQERFPSDFWIYYTLGNALTKQNPEEAVGYYRAALALRPGTAAAHISLGKALGDKGRLDEAMAEFHKASALDPKDPLVHSNLGYALHLKGKRDEGIAEFHKALALDPRHPEALSNLVNALTEKGRLDEAITACQKALALDPKSAPVHLILGYVLHVKGRLDEAIAEFRKSLELDPNYALAHSNLGNALRDKRQLDEAVAECQKAIDLDAKNALAHNNLGNALQDKGLLTEAVAAHQKAIALDPKLMQAYGALGLAHLRLGQFPAARQATQHCLDLLAVNHPLHPIVLRQLRQCEQMLVLEKKLAAIEKGQEKPGDGNELVSLAQLCQLQKRPVAAARFFTDAFAALPKLADDLQSGQRYNAACSAALAAAGQGQDAIKLDDKERVRLRRQALDWLRADLALWGKQVESAKTIALPVVRQTLQHWQKDTDLAAVRDAAALGRLSEDERAAWQTLWHDVDELLRRVAGQKTKP